MANNYTEILALANKNNMGLSNTIKRDYGIPLDYSSVQKDYEAALSYAKNSTLAYVGQLISVGDTLYIVTDKEHGYLKNVGTNLAADNISIDVDDTGKLTLKGFATAVTGTFPQKRADGTLEWVTLDTSISGGSTTQIEIVINEELPPIGQIGVLYVKTAEEDACISIWDEVKKTYRIIASKPQEAANSDILNLFNNG